MSAEDPLHAHVAFMAGVFVDWPIDSRKGKGSGPRPRVGYWVVNCKSVVDVIGIKPSEPFRDARLRARGWEPEQIPLIVEVGRFDDESPPFPSAAGVPHPLLDS